MIKKEEAFKKAISLSVCDGHRLNYIVNLIEKLSHLSGDIAEVGVYRGGTALAIASQFQNTDFFCFDTFEGLPQETKEDNYHKKGDFADVVFEDVLKHFEDYSHVHIYKGEFPKTNSEVVAGRKFKFVHVDVDLYQGHLDCINFFFPLLVTGGVMLFDDYLTSSCRGAKQAVDEFVSQNNITLERGAGSQAFIRKKES